MRMPKAIATATLPLTALVLVGCSTQPSSTCASKEAVDQMTTYITRELSGSDTELVSITNPIVIEDLDYGQRCEITVTAIAGGMRNSNEQQWKYETNTSGDSLVIQVPRYSLSDVLSGRAR